MRTPGGEQGGGSGRLSGGGGRWAGGIVGDSLSSFCTRE